MFATDGSHFLDIESIVRVTIPTAICLDIDGKTDIRTDIMVSGGCMIVNIGCVLLGIKFFLYLIIHLPVGDMVIEEILQNPEELPAEDTVMYYSKSLISNIREWKRLFSDITM